VEVGDVVYIRRIPHDIPRSRRRGRVESRREQHEVPAATRLDLRDPQPVDPHCPRRDEPATVRERQRPAACGVEGAGIREAVEHPILDRPRRRPRLSDVAARPTTEERCGENRGGCRSS